MPAPRELTRPPLQSVGVLATSDTSTRQSPRELVRELLAANFRIVTWRCNGDAKGPYEEGWQNRIYTLDDYREGYRVGLITGHEIAPGRFLHDVDIDWAPGLPIAVKLLLQSDFVFGRPSKPISHCFYTAPKAIPTFKYEDIDGTCLIELRGVKANGDIGFQTMSPPSIWSKDGKREPLQFVRRNQLTHLDSVDLLKSSVMLTAIGMLLAKHLGYNGFGHEARLAWAGFLLRAGVAAKDLIAMGEGMSELCNNLELGDVRVVVESTVRALANREKVKGGPALAKLLGAHGKQVIARINEWLGREQNFIRNADGNILAKNQHNIRRAIILLGHELTYNEFSAKRLLDRRPLEDAQADSLYLAIDNEFHFQPPLEYFRMVVNDMAAQNSFHPVKDYLDSLTWDGEPRIATWLIGCAGAEDNKYVRAISSIMLIAAVRRIRQPGCKYDEMVVFEGPQGWNKSSALHALCPHSDWFTDDLRLNLHSQQLIEATLGKWIVEASDLAGKRKTEIEQLKAMLSRQVDGPARMAYAHFPVERPRQFIIIGTTNSKAYLPDTTGARRFWPVEVQRFDVEKIRLHRDQLWAEACVREAQGASIRLPEELWNDAKEQQEERREVDPWEETLLLYLNGGAPQITSNYRGAPPELVTPSTDGKRRVTSENLFAALGIEVARRDRPAQLRVSQIMQRLGFKNGSVRRDGKSVPGYVQIHKGALDFEHNAHKEHEKG
jgi:predicted P-loop ATPase